MASRFLPASVTFNTTVLNKASIDAFITKKERRFLREGGRMVAEKTRGSLRKTGKTSNPGSPPTSRTGKLKRNIRFAVDANRISSVIGAVPLRDSASRGTAPKTLEYGGRRTAKEVLPKIRIGGIHPVDAIKTPKKGYIEYKPKGRKPKEKFYVFFKEIRTQKELQEALRTDKKLNPRSPTPGFILARPYLQPALVSVSPVINNFFN